MQQAGLGEYIFLVTSKNFSNHRQSKHGHPTHHRRPCLAHCVCPTPRHPRQSCQWHSRRFAQRFRQTRNRSPDAREPRRRGLRAGSLHRPSLSNQRRIIAQAFASRLRGRNRPPGLDRRTPKTTRGPHQSAKPPVVRRCFWHWLCSRQIGRRRYEPGLCC